MKNVSKKTTMKSSDAKSKTNPEISKKKTLRTRFKSVVVPVNERRKSFLDRRPHRSFRRTKRRDYSRSMKVPGYIKLTVASFLIIKNNKWTFFSLILFYSILTLILSNAMSQEAYQELSDIANEASKKEGFLSSVPVVAIFLTVFTSQAAGTLFGEMGSAQQIIGVIFSLFIWLSSVWLTRAIMAGKRVRMRDGLYRAGGPIVALMILAFVVLIQSIPAAVALMAYSAAAASGLLNQTAILMLFGGATILLVTLSLYWIVSTLIAMIIVTLPGMYPGKALRLAGDLVVGRRLRIMLRALWIVVMIFLTWALIVLPTIVLDSKIKSALPGVDWLPIVPVVSTLMTSASVVFLAVYVYVLYRKVVSDETPPA